MKDLAKQNALQRLIKSGVPEEIQDLRRTRKQQLADFADRQTQDPEDDILGPALATAASLFSEHVVPDPEDPLFEPGIAGTVSKVGRVGKAGAQKLLDDIAKVKGDRAARAEKQRRGLEQAETLSGDEMQQFSQTRRLERAREGAPTKGPRDAQEVARKEAADPRVRASQEAATAKSMTTQDMLKAMEGRVSMPMGGWESLTREQVEQLYSVRHYPDVMNKVLQRYGK